MILVSSTLSTFLNHLLILLSSCCITSIESIKLTTPIIIRYSCLVESGLVSPFVQFRHSFSLPCLFSSGSSSWLMSASISISILSVPIFAGSLNVHIGFSVERFFFLLLVSDLFFVSIWSAVIFTSVLACHFVLSGMPSKRVLGFHSARGATLSRPLVGLLLQLCDGSLEAVCHNLGMTMEGVM